MGRVKLTCDLKDTTNQRRLPPFDVVDEVHRLANRPPSGVDFDSSEMPGSHVTDHAAAGHDAEALTHGRNALDRLVRRDLHRDPHVDTVRRELLLD